MLLTLPHPSLSIRGSMHLMIGNQLEWLIDPMLASRPRASGYAGPIAKYKSRFFNSLDTTPASEAVF